MDHGAVKCIDLFSGAGGLSTGLEQAGWKAVMAVETDPDCVATYQENFGDAEVFDCDIRELDFTPCRQTVHLVAGGPPCQPFSVAGHLRGPSDARDMIPEFIRAVAEVRPASFMFENVPGLATRRNRAYLNLRIQELEDLGYRVAYEVLNAADYGVPQSRRRLFVVGLRSGRFSFPEPTHGPGRAHPYRTSGEVLADTPSDKPSNSIVTYARRPILRPSPWTGMLVNGKGRPINLSEPSPTIPASAGGNRTHIIDPEGVLRAYHTHLMSGGSPRSGLVEGVRRLTLRESASLQTFPPGFVFVGRRSSQYSQVGNAVPPRLAAVLGREILRSLSRQAS